MDYDCIAQCHDGASVMSGEHSGVQGRIQNIVEHYMCALPCSRAKSSFGFYRKTLDCVRTFFWNTTVITLFFSLSGKRHSALQKDHQLPSTEIPGLSDTRWACRFQSVL